MNLNFGAVLKGVMVARGVRQGDLAKKLGVSRELVKYWCVTKDIKLGRVLELEGALGVDLLRELRPEWAAQVRVLEDELAVLREELRDVRKECEVLNRVMGVRG